MAPPSRQLFPNRYHAIASSRSSRSSTISSHSENTASNPQTAKLTTLGSEIRNPHLDPRTRPPQRTREATNNSDTTASSFQSPYKSPHDASVFVGKYVTIPKPREDRRRIFDVDPYISIGRFAPSLPQHISDLDLIVALNSHFNRVTRVQHIKVVPDPRNNSRCAFIQVENAEEAQKAVKELGGQDFCGSILRCELARAHRSLLLSIRHPKELRGLDKIEWVRLRRNRGDRTVHVTLGEEAKEEPEVDASPWPHRDPLQGVGRLISLDNLFDEGREEAIRELVEVFGAIEQFGRFLPDDPATVYDPHPRPGSWLHDPKDEKGLDTERGNNYHPRGPWEIKYERRNDSVSAFMALKQIPLFNISRTHTHRPADIGFLTAGNVSYDPQPSLPRGIFAHLPVPAEVIVDDQRQGLHTASIPAKNKAKRMRRGVGTAANARSQPAEDFPPLSKTESKKRPDEDTETGAPKPAGAWKMIKELSEAPKMERSDATKFYERLPFSAAEATTEEPIQQPRADTFKSLEQLIFDSSDSESVRKVENVLGLSVNSSHKAETSRKPMKPTTCIDIMSKVKISGERWDQKRLLGVFSVYQGCLRVDYKLKRKPAGSFVAHVEFEAEDQAKAAFEAEKEHPAFGKQMRLVPARRHRDQQPPRVQLQPAPAELIVRNAEQVIEPHVPAEHQDEMEGLSPALSSTLQAESPRPSTSRTDEIEVTNLPGTKPPTPSAHATGFEEPEQLDEESCIDAMVIEVSEGTFDGDDGGDEKDVIPTEAEDYKVGKEPSEGQEEGATKEEAHALGRLVTSVSTPGLLFGGGDSEVELLKIGHLSPTRPLVHRRALSDSDHLKMDCSLDVTLRETIRLPEDVQSALLRLPPTKFHYPHVPEWRESEIQAASPLQQVASSTGSGSEAIPQPEQASPPISNSSPVTSPTVSPFGALVYIPPPFDSGSTGSSVRHFNSPVPAKGFVETPHGLLPIYPMEVLDRFGRSAPAYYPPQYPVLPQSQWNQPQAWQHQQPEGQWMWSNYPPANHPYSMPLTPGYNQSVHATVAQQQTMVPLQGLQPVDAGNQPGAGVHAHQMSRNSSGEPHGRRRRLSQQRRSRPPVYHDPSPAYNSSQQALSSPHPVTQSYITLQHNDNGYHQAHNYNSYQRQPMAPQATTEPPSLYPVNEPQAQANLYIQSQSAFNQQLYSPLPFQLHQQPYQHAPPPFSAAPMYHYSTTQSEPTPGPPTQHSDHPAMTYSVT